MPEPALYGFGLESKRFPAAPQRAALVAFGVPPKRVIIEDRQEHEEFDYMVERSLRDPGDMVAVHKFHLLAPGAAELRRRIKAVHAKQAVIVEVGGRRSDDRDALTEMIFEAHQVYSGRLLDPKTASRMGKKGAKSRAPLDRMPVEEARKLWRAKHHRNWQEALAAVNADTSYHGYSKSSAYELLGPRDVKPGRKRN
jgi:hypothetical protein